MPIHTRGTVATMRQELLALGAETLYRKLAKQLDALKRAYPNIKRLEPPSESNGHGGSPPTEALQMFRRHKAQRSPAQVAVLAKARKMKALKAQKTRRLPSKRETVANLTDGTMVKNAVLLLQERGPSTAFALASALYDGGWRPRESCDTDLKRAAAVSVVLRNLVLRKLVRVVNGEEKPYTFEATK